MSCSVIGIDVGSLTSYIGAAKGGGVEILSNEVSDRCNPSFVAFNKKFRFLGCAAEQQMVTNIGNTITSFSRLMGKMESDSIIEFERKHTFFDIASDSQGRAVIKVEYNDKSLSLLPKQVFAMYLRKLVEVAESSLGTKVVDIVLSIPSYYTDRERRAYLDASKIAGVNCIRLVNETTAISIAYGLTKKDLPAVDQPSRNVVFVSLGNSNLQVAVVAFNAGKMKVISLAFDPCLGGRDFDMCIFHHLVKEIEAKYKLKVITNRRACVRLLKSCVTLKKFMSANSTEIPVNVECLMNDVDVALKMDRKFFESLCEPLLSRIKQTMEKAFKLANLKLEDVHSVELIGGGVRIPAVKKLVVDVFGKEGSTTLNADEAVARGCAFQAAICSPAFKVREFSIVDACPYSISLYWNPTDTIPEDVKDEDVSEVAKGSTIEVFKHLSCIPASKLLKFYRRGDFTLTAKYSHTDGLHSDNSLIGSFNIINVVPQTPGSLCQVRVKARVNSNGIFTINNAVIMERVEKEFEVPIEEPKAEVSVDENKSKTKIETNNATSVAEKTAQPPPETNDTDEKAVMQPSPPKPTTRIEKKVVLHPRDIPVETTISQLSEAQLLGLIDFQAELDQNDRISRECQNLKNALEAYVYEMRDKLTTCLQQHVTQAECISFQKALSDTEDWIYGEGESASKSIISKRHEVLKQTGDRYCLRFTEFDSRPTAINALASMCEQIRKVLQSYESGDPTYDHLTKEDMAKVGNALKDKQQRLDAFLEASGNLQRTSDPVVLVADLYNSLKDLENVCIPIISRPKPAPPPPTPSPMDNINEKAAGEPKANGKDNLTPTSGCSKTLNNTKSGNVTSQTTPAAATGENMDVD